MTTTVKSKVTPEGYVVDNHNKVIGFKCVHCSTVHLIDDFSSQEIIVLQISQFLDIHKDCQALLKV